MTKKKTVARVGSTATASTVSLTAETPMGNATDAKRTEQERPTFLKEHHLLFLDDLRQSGVTNMYGATPYIRSAYGVSQEKASAILLYWMKTFSERHAARKS
jgi:hypothetical protein